jgi:hypothetical protein
MKRVLSILLLSVLVFGTFEFALPTNTFAQTTVTRTRYHRRHRSFWKKHRDKLTVAGTTLGGAAIGGLAGGKKGAAIGSAIGGGAGTGVVLATDGKEIRLAEGRKLKVSLTNPLTIRTK